MSSVEVLRLTADRVADFWAVHADEQDCGWCYCVAWWVPTWDGFPDRSADDNRRMREDLFARGEHDGYVLRADGVPAAWCQVGPRDRLPQVAALYGLPPDPEVWAATCFVVQPRLRGRGLAHDLLRGVLDDLPSRGVRRIQGFPRRGRHDAGEVWTGPEGVYVRAGFRVVAESARGPVYERAV